MWRVNWPKVGGGGDRNKELTKEELFKKMVAWDKENFIVGAGTADSGGSAGMVDDHSYTVISAHPNVCGTGINLLKVRNPWGKGEVEDGMFDDDGPGWDQYPQIKAKLNPVVAGEKTNRMTSGRYRSQRRFWGDDCSLSNRIRTSEIKSRHCIDTRDLYSCCLTVERLFPPSPPEFHYPQTMVFFM